MPLAAAAANAAVEPDLEEAEGAAGSAPTCPLCLSPRKQVLRWGKIPFSAQNFSPSRRQRARRAGMCTAGGALPVLAAVQSLQFRPFVILYFRVAGEETRVSAL